jgi:hypothetical protein
MAAASLFFKKMFTSGMKESREGEVHLQEIDFNALSLIVRASYGEKLKLNGDNVQSILEASDRLEMREYIDDCIIYMCNHMDSDNCLDLYLISKKYSHDQLKRSVVEYLVFGDNFADCMTCSDSLLSNIHLLTKNDWMDLVSIICKDFFDITPKVLMLILEWAQTDTSHPASVISILENAIFECCKESEFNNVLKSKEEMLVKAGVYDEVKDRIQQSFVEDTNSDFEYDDDFYRPYGSQDEDEL